MTELASSAPPPVLALVLTNSGGEGKSTWAEVLAALARLAGKKVLVADIDPGNRGYLNRNGDDSALSLDWSLSSIGGPASADPAEWFDEHLAEHQIAILDTGANMLAAANPINRFVGGLIEVAHRKGARIVVYGVTSPNKAGSDELIEMMYQRFRRGAEVVVVQNDRDGSKAFKASISQLGTPIVSVPHIQPGLQAVRLRRCIPLDEVLTEPEAGFERATAMIARSLMQVTEQEPVIEIVGKAAHARLEVLAAEAPASTYYRISNIGVADNESLRANHSLARAWSDFRSADKNDASRFLQVSTVLWDAEKAWRSRKG